MTVAAPPIGSRGFTGQGPLERAGGSRRAGSGFFHRDCSRRKLCPNPICSRTPLVAPPDCMPVGVTVTRSNGPASRRRYRRLAPRSRLRGVPRAGPPPAPLREKEMHSAAPEVPSIERAPFRERPFPQLVTNLWSRARAFSISAPCRARTVRRGCGDSASPREWIGHPRGAISVLERMKIEAAAALPSISTSRKVRGPEIGRAHV